MNLQLVTWTFQSLVVPMIQLPDGKLYCTSKALCDALGLSTAALKQLHKSREKQLSPLRVSQTHSKEFFVEHRVRLGLSRVRADMVLWSERDMIRIAMWSQAPNALDFQESLIDMVRDAAVKQHVPQSTYDAIVARLEEQGRQLRELQEVVFSAHTALQTTASAAGSALAAQRGTKTLRLVK